MSTVFFRADLDIYVIRVKLDSDTTAIALVAGDKEYMYGHKNMHSTNKNDKHSASFSERFLFRKFHAALALFGNIQHNHHSRGGWLKSKHPVASTQRPPLHDC